MMSRDGAGFARFDRCDPIGDMRHSEMARCMTAQQLDELPGIEMIRVVQRSGEGRHRALARGKLSDGHILLRRHRGGEGLVRLRLPRGEKLARIARSGWGRERVLGDVVWLARPPAVEA